MAAVAPQKAGLSTGTLGYGMSDLAGGFPYSDGTALGLCTRLALRSRHPFVPVVREEDNADEDVLICGGPFVMGCSLEAWDDDAIAAFAPRSKDGGSGSRVIQWPVIPKMASSIALEPLVFAASDATNNASLIVYKAAPLFAEVQEVELRSYRFWRLNILFRGLPDATGRVAEMGKLSVLSI